MSEKEGQSRKRKTCVSLENSCVRNFMPSWFAVNMGTGSVSNLLWNFPYGSQRVLHTFGAAFLVLNILLFFVFCTISVARYARYPKLVGATFRHPLQSLYLGCFSMGFATIINTTLSINQEFGFGGKPLLYTLWGLWWLDSAVSLGIYFWTLRMMIIQHTHSIKSLTAVWLIPAVTPIVPATTGALLARGILAYSVSHTILTLLMSAVLLLIGLFLALTMLPLYLFRLITEGLPENTFIMTKFLPVGPCGQGGAAFVIIGQVFADISHRGLSNNVLLQEPQPWSVLGACCGFALWTFGIWWIVLAILGVYDTFRYNPPQFAVGFWGIVFPLGVYAYLTLILSDVLGSTTIKVIATVLAIVVLLLWAALAIKTVYQVFWRSEQLFQALSSTETYQNPGPTSDIP